MNSWNTNFTYNFCLCNANAHKVFTDGIKMSINTYSNALAIQCQTVASALKISANCLEIYAKSPLILENLNLDDNSKTDGEFENTPIIIDNKKEGIN